MGWLRRRSLLVLLLTPLSSVAVEMLPPDIRFQPAGHGSILTDARGMTLYTYALDQKSGPPVCIEKCAQNWPPLLANSASGATDVDAHGKDWSLVWRDDGSRQWAFRGRPLYRSVRDALPGDQNGDELQQKWYAAVKPIATPPSFGILKTPLGYLLVEHRRMSVYASSKQRSTPADCVDACARQWRPIEAAAMAVPPSADWAVAARNDGTRQWTYKGKSLYRYAGDFNPGESNGDNIAPWSVVVLQKAPDGPRWVTRQQSDGGELFADAAGKTLYGHDPDGYHLGRLIEHPEWWRPVLADANARAVGPWAIVTNEAGQRQWAHKGLRLFTNLRDREPGDINGVRSGDRVWRPIMTSGQTMPGSGL